mmetsp:Transcript_17636/g.44020  ORF Transcript_17636/g.44020 Transcript_17636/m.44020 type:complete len:393 (-) Transcript_17636:544-1722(-)
MNEDIQLPTYKDLEKAFTALWTYKFLHLRQTAPGRGAPAIVPVPDDEDAILQEATNKMSVNKYQLVTPADLAWQYRGDVDAPNVIRRWYDVLRFAMETLVRGERVRGADLLRPERMLERTYVTESTPAMDLTRQQLQMLSDDPRRPENEERLRDVQQSTHDSHAFVDATAKVDPDSAQAQELRADRVRKFFAQADARMPPPPVISLTGPALNEALSAAYYYDPRLLDASTPMPGDSSGAVAPWLGFHRFWVPIPKQPKVNPLEHLRPYMNMRKDQTGSASDMPARLVRGDGNGNAAGPRGVASGDSEADDDEHEEDANSVAEDEDLGMTGAANVADSAPRSDLQLEKMQCFHCKKWLPRAEIAAHLEAVRKQMKRRGEERVNPNFLFNHDII